jgi:hypothetical protein
VPLLLLGPPFFPIILFWSTTLLTGMTGISLQMQWPLTHSSFLKWNNWFFVTDQTPRLNSFYLTTTLAGFDLTTFVMND